MISYLTGTIQQKIKNSLIILTPGGVGYEVGMTLVQIAEAQVGQLISLYTYLRVGESVMELYGFTAMEERSFFLLLLGVTGVGPKSAMNILGLGSIEEIQAAIGRGDVKYLTAVQGMGKKTAERLVVELKSKVISHKSKVSIDGGEELVGDVMGEVIEALVGMGYQKEEVKRVVKEMDVVGKKTEEVLRDVLRLLAKH